MRRLLNDFNVRRRCRCGRNVALKTPIDHPSWPSAALRPTTHVWNRRPPPQHAIGISPKTDSRRARTTNRGTKCRSCRSRLSFPTLRRDEGRSDFTISTTSQLDSGRTSLAKRRYRRGSFEGGYAESAPMSLFSSFNSLYSGLSSLRGARLRRGARRTIGSLSFTKRSRTTSFSR